MTHSLCIEEFFNEGTVLSLDARHLLIGWGERQWLPTCPLHSPAFYFPDFFLQSPAPWFTHPHTTTMEKTLLGNFLQAPALPPPIQWLSGCKHQFSAIFEGLQELIHSGKLIKGVPYSIASARHPMSTVQLRTSLSHALKASGNIYGFWDQTQGLLGVTPEFLFRLDGKLAKPELHTEAIAGTGISPSLADDPKILREHTLVAEGIISSLSHFGTPHCDELRTIKLPHFYHLKTPIRMTLSTRPEYEALVRALHPTPAIGAFPREPGWTWLKTLQDKMNRHRYGAPVGAVCDAKYLCYAAIRNVQWFTGEMIIGAGCGVIEESDPKEEWKEINLKTKAIRSILAL